MEICEIGELPPIGVVPQYMHAQVLRRERYGTPISAFQSERIKVPEIKDDEVLIAVMAAGLNYNSVWASVAYPVDMIQLIQQRGELKDNFYIAGSDCSGVVYKKGINVSNVNIGDEIVVHGGWFDPNDTFIRNGGDPTISKTFRAWGYETSYGAFAQFCVVKHFQCLPKATHLNWDEAAVYMVSGVTAYRMLHHYQPHTIKHDDVVLIWGGAGGLGTMAIQLVKAADAIPVAIVSNDEKAIFCQNLGALTLNRSHYDFWGALTPEMVKPENQEEWRNLAKQFLKEVLKITNGRQPRIIIEHPGESTFPTSLYVCDRDGMVITCAGTTGYMGSFDLRYLWLQNKRIQGSHYANPEECIKLNNLVRDKIISPILAETYNFEKLPYALQLMYENRHPAGSMALRIGY
jgi:crotonyl-CoA carboxylase/reductase